MALKFSDSGRRMMAISMRESAHSAFGGYLLHSIKGFNFDKMPATFECKYQVPPSLCSPSIVGKKHSYMPTSSILALLDEISAHMVIGVDKNFRPGVSVLLSTELLKPVAMNDNVLVATHVDKIGKYMGFCTMEIYDEKGQELLARGKQIKFMPAGLFFEVISQPFIFPLFAKFYYHILGKRFRYSAVDHLLPEFAKNVPTKTSPPEKIIEDEEVGTIFTSLSIEKVPDAIDYSHLSGHEANSGYYLVHVQKEMMNPLGSFHGGAVAASLEDACRAYKEELCQELSIHPIIQSMEVRYLASMKVKYSSYCIFAADLLQCYSSLLF